MSLRERLAVSALVHCVLAVLTPEAHALVVTFSVSAVLLSLGGGRRDRRREQGG